MAKQPYYEFKILLVGDPAVGKTSLILKYVENRFEREYKASIGVDFAYKIIELEDKVARLIIWDIASQERFGPYRSSFYKQTDGAMLVFDLTRPETLEAIEAWMREIREHAGDVEILLIGNKADLKKKREIKKSEIQKWVERYGCSFVETSAMSGDMVEDAFLMLTKQIIEKLEQ
jgi:small GTP-binding protein